VTYNRNSDIGAGDAVAFPCKDFLGKFGWSWPSWTKLRRSLGKSD